MGVGELKVEREGRKKDVCSREWKLQRNTKDIQQQLGYVEIEKGITRPLRRERREVTGKERERGSEKQKE